MIRFYWFQKEKMICQRRITSSFFAIFVWRLCPQRMEASWRCATGTQTSRHSSARGGSTQQLSDVSAEGLAFHGISCNDLMTDGQTLSLSSSRTQCLRYPPTNQFELSHCQIPISRIPLPKPSRKITFLFQMMVFFRSFLQYF